MARLSAYVAPLLASVVGGMMAVMLRMLQPVYPYIFTSKADTQLTSTAESSSRIMASAAACIWRRP